MVHLSVTKLIFIKILGLLWWYKKAMTRMKVYLLQDIINYLHNTHTYPSIIHSYLSMCSVIRTVFSTGLKVFCQRCTSDTLKLLILSDNFRNFDATFRYPLLTNSFMSNIHYNDSLFLNWLNDPNKLLLLWSD